MGSVRALVLRRIAAAGLILALAAAAGLSLVKQTRAVSHLTPPIWVDEIDRKSVGVIGTSSLVRVGIDEPLEEDVIIAAEIESGPNDPDDGVSYGTPDRHCVIAAGGYDCVLEFDWYVTTSVVTVRIFVSSSSVVVDTEEGPRPLNLVFVTPGCVLERDATEVVEFSVIGTGGDAPPPPAPAPGANPDPHTCETQPQQTGSPSPSGTPTDTGSPTPTDTGSPTPSGTMTATPTATASPSYPATPTPTETPEPVVFNSPFEGRYREQQCRTYLPANTQTQCEASGEAFAESGLAHAVAAVRPADGDAATMAQGDASAGIIQSASVPGSGSILVRFRVHEATVEARAASPTLGGPYGGLEVWVHASSQCTTASSMQMLPIDGSGSIENQVVEVRIDYAGCDALTSIQAGVRAAASTMPGAAGAVRAEITASIERITVQ